MARLFLVAGEVSGDRIGGLIARQLIDLGHEVIGWGGENMKDTGATVVRDLSELNVMGYTNLVRSIPRIFSLLQSCKRDILASNPDILVLIDFGSFNLRIAQWAHKRIDKVVYYSPPKIWASRPGRISLLRKYCHQIVVLFPFEQEYYTQHQLKTEYYGHPLIEEIQNYKINQVKNALPKESKKMIAILPGSRRQEVNRHLPVYLNSIKSIPNHRIGVSTTPETEQEVRKICDKHKTTDVTLYSNLYDLLLVSNVAIVTSGTATLEVGLFNIPQIVCYRTSTLNYVLAKWMIKVPYISLINLLVNKKVVEELIQNRCNSSEIRSNVLLLLEQKKKSNLDNYYRDIIESLNHVEIIKSTASAITT